VIYSEKRPPEVWRLFQIKKKGDPCEPPLFRGPRQPGNVPPAHSRCVQPGTTFAMSPLSSLGHVSRVRGPARSCLTPYTPRGGTVLLNPASQPMTSCMPCKRSPAIDWPQYSKGKFDAIQREAEHAGRGVWMGSYVEPWLYRVCVRAGGSPANCSDDANATP
jgi:hypothetical protein